MDKSLLPEIPNYLSIMCHNILPAWKPKEDMPPVLQQGVVLP